MEKMSSITFPDGTTYEVVDAEARKRINNIPNDCEETFAFLTTNYVATNEENLCLQICQEFLQTGKAHGFINITWDANDYFTGTISRYASSSAQLIIGRANQSYILKAKSNGETITMAKIQ